VRMNKYASYEELKQYEREGKDYEILIREGVSGIAVVAPHGGGIEPGTDDIADCIAGTEHSFYCFKGMKQTGNADLHITSDKFDEPYGLKIIKKAKTVLAIHGCKGNEPIVHLGGMDDDLIKKMEKLLAGAGFKALRNPRQGLKGKRSRNICNQGRTGQGVQIEISVGLRRKMFDDLIRGDGRNKTAIFYRFISALRKTFPAEQS